ncbi:type II secretion system protein GspM [Halioxenophilus sp. WMMB6]|uniref:type II secretion system protein GspM n=1 Tax=Halioxenophilus sp. WMMB6 TaxID=3073815 RepID=UPI00295F351A|nr:type II secretion system protein GspM [Halioxenophilus sp. WMMB6]
MNALSNYWLTLGRRDQTALLLCALAVALALIWWLLIQPSNRALVSQEVNTRAAAESLARVREMALELKQYRAGNSDTSSTQAPLSELIDSTLRTRGMSLSSFQPVREGEVRLRLDDVAYSAFVAWLVTMETEQKLAARELTITPTRVSGRVSVSLRLAR